MQTSYADFIHQKKQLGGQFGFAPLWMPDFLFDFQAHLVDWSLRKGRAALFEDCGLGKTAQQLVYAQNVVMKTNRPVLVLTPLSVGAQTVAEGEKFGIECKQSRDGSVAGKITVTNYQQLHKFDWKDFDGVVCDESSILKNPDGVTKEEVTEFMRKIRYRSLWTATAAPNDYIELGTSSEALGDLGFSDMLNMFFKKAEKTMSRKDEYRSGLYRFRGHAQNDFWRWVCSWARAVRKPSDIGFRDDKYKLPDLVTTEHVVRSSVPNPEYLFDMPAVGLQEQRAERRRSIEDRCEQAARLINGSGKPAFAWCHLDDEGKTLKRMIPDSIEVHGRDSDEEKEEAFSAFVKGEIRVIVSKPTIAGYGLNFQHCAHMTTFPSHSFEQWYQSIRRFWRFGQKQPVHVDIISSEAEAGVLANMNRKAIQAEQMFSKLVELISNELSIEKKNNHTNEVSLPDWL